MIQGVPQATVGVVPEQVAEIIVSLGGGVRRRGSGYRVGSGAVLTAAHVIEGALSVRVRFDADLPGEWSTEAVVRWADPNFDLAVLTIVPRAGERTVAARFGRIAGDRAAVLAARAVGFPRFKLKHDGVGGNSPQLYRDSHQADGSVAVLSNRREGTLEITVSAPERDPDPMVSPWEGMSGAAVWVGEHIVGVIVEHHRSDGLGRLAATRLDLAMEGLDPGDNNELQDLLGLPATLPDVVTPSVGERRAAAYLAQARTIIPDQLLDRDDELDELVEFCAGDRPYAWWQARPWAGKSALMAWFVLHPPAGVDVVSFFVTAQLAGQSDRDACTDALIEQLAALLGESLAGLLTSGTRLGTLLRLLDDASTRSRETGRRLLLVIDGLDEDSSFGPGTARSSSIADLLPHRPPPGVRILVASRPHPPVPDDVDDEHPLRTVTPRQLTVSVHARGVERRARRELNQLLAGSELQLDVLGLVTAAGGGLTLRDLEELTERPPYEIDGVLGGPFGRSVESRPGTPVIGRPGERVYLFTHETLQIVAERRYGSTLAAYRDRLHNWADTWRQRGWPADIPQYLLRSYPRMLARTEDLSRLVSYATDRARHDRMRDLTGGDALAVTEISAAQQLLRAQPGPDLTGLALLAVQREHLTQRNSNIPAELPGVWARLGQPARAQALADSIPDPDQRSWASARVAEALATAGDLERAETLSARIDHPDRRAQVLARLAEAAGATGDHERATRLARQAEAVIAQIDRSPGRRAQALARLAQAAATGDRERATRLTDEAAALSTRIEHPEWRAQVLAGLAEAVSATGDRERATRLTDEAAALTSRIEHPEWRAEALARLAEAVTTTGDPERATRLAGQAEALATQVDRPDERLRSLTSLAEGLTALGDIQRAETLAAQITHPHSQAQALARLAAAAGVTGEIGQVVRLAWKAETLTVRITGADLRAGVLTQLIKPVSAAGDHEWAARLVRKAQALIMQIAGSAWRAEVLARLAHAVTVIGDHERAEALAAQITDTELQVKALAGIAEAASAAGDVPRATRLARESETLTEQIAQPHWQAQALARLAEAANATGDLPRAARLAHESETVTTRITNPYLRAEALARLTEALTSNGDHERAEALTALITDLELRAQALIGLVRAMSPSGASEGAARLAGQAETVARKIPDTPSRIHALTRLATVLAERAGHISPAGHVGTGRSASMAQAGRLLAEVLVTSSWRPAISALARIEPSAVRALADELMVRWKLPGPAGSRDSRERLPVRVVSRMPVRRS